MQCVGGIYTQVGIPETQVYAEVLPSHKKDKVTYFQNRNIKVISYLYDGIEHNVSIVYS